MAELAVATKALDFKLEQVQDFTPTPMTVATTIYYSGYHPYSLQKIDTAKSEKEKKQQNMFFFWYKREFREQIMTLLRRIHRADLSRNYMEKREKNRTNVLIIQDDSLTLSNRWASARIVYRKSYSNEISIIAYSSNFPDSL